MNLRHAAALALGIVPEVASHGRRLRMNQFGWSFLFWFLGGFAYLIVFSVFFPHVGLLTLVIGVLVMVAVVKLLIFLLFR
jgi:uncharacterized membrane protein HdeD (DUF308 family)